MHIEIPTDIFTFPEIPMPAVWRVEQRSAIPALTAERIKADAKKAVEILLATKQLPAGSKVAVGVGSRGLDNLVLLVRSVVEALRENGFTPFLVPAMGSHGGATAKGQEELLHGYGITPEATGAELRATMDTKLIGNLEGKDAGPYAGQPVYCDMNARNADAILLINRIKAHTDFMGEIESGIAKMCAIGLGKRKGAESIHAFGAEGLRSLMPRIARFMAEHLPLLGGVAVLENALGQTCELHPLPADAVGREPETALLNRARQIAPHLPFQQLDVLVIEEMGKNISGACMDTHVIGRGIMPSIPESGWDGPDIRLIAVLDLTESSHGNGASLGLADLTTEKLVEKMNFEETIINMRTSGEGGIMRARMPVILPDGKACVQTAMATCGRARPSQVRLARIRNTADIRYLEISEPVLEEALQNPDLIVEKEGHILDLERSVAAG